MRLSRDEVVTRGMDAALQSTASFTAGKRTSQWLYTAKIKSGTRKTRMVVGSYWNINHLYAEMIVNHAREGESFNVYGISRVMKRSYKSRNEDI